MQIAVMEAPPPGKPRCHPQQVLSAQATMSFVDTMLKVSENSLAWHRWNSEISKKEISSVPNI
jgi:hypothetical protein